MAIPAQKHDVFQAIADPTRRHLLQLLGDQEMPVTVISSHFPMSRTAVSKHLRILAEAGLVKERKVGRETRYRLEAEPLMELKRWLSYYERYWENKLNVLKRFVEQDDDAAELKFTPLEVVDPE
ncbi:ArsR/SmtB family transcription factor [Paenibacillus qinlingensis]|uniref:ArsR/SmtB family transcription factor n=1 Tax=Paenibacillus qinlingensis TaxID=1837343 RepID=UPI001566997B|nr:metalloregulator ArsR/SmtB family transcription factor [Paenibacillus qinlingensis]NQX64355.1 winged helix-turn-helix transcriptional regulator [Paenibacillus qinlingensis]